MSAKKLLEAAEAMKEMSVARATGSMDGRDDEYRRHRDALLASMAIRAKVPEFIRTCRNLAEFWGYIKGKGGSYQDRRDYLRDEFHALLSMLETDATSPGDVAPSDLLARLDWEEVQAAWRRALERKTIDPEGAITAARTLLETVCKHILDDAAVSYDPKADLPKLYGLTAERLKLAPSQHTEDIFKQVLGGCHSVVQGLGALRSRVGDAHGQGKRPVKPAPRHAELAVNLAGAVATFLAQTWENAKEKPAP